MKPKKLLSFLLATAMTISLLPTFTLTASAATTTTEKNITLGTSALKGGQASNVYFGNYQQSSLGNTKPTTGTEGVDWIKNSNGQINGQGAYYKKDPIKWRVLSNDGSKLFLLSDKNLDVVCYHEDNEAVTWATSTIRSWLNGYEASSNTGGESGIDYTSDNFIGSAFSENEKKEIVSTTVEENIQDKVFLLSIEEAQNTAYGFTDNASSTDTRKAVNTAYVYGGGKNGTRNMWGIGVADYWWLRSPGHSTRRAASVRNFGGVDGSGDDVDRDSDAVRPAFNLNPASVLFTSATDGKNTNNVGKLLENAENSGNEYKLTLLDTSREFEVEETSAKGEQITLNYDNAKTGSNEHISAMIVKDGDVLYYGQGEKTETSPNENGTEKGKVKFTLPNEIENGEYTLYVFNEQINGNKKTDISSAFQTVTLNVLPKATFTKAPTKKTNLIYDSKEQELVTAGETSDGTVKYSLSENGTYSADIPTGKNAGTYTVWYYIEGDSNHLDSNKASIEVTIAKADSQTTTTADATVTYGETLTLTATVTKSARALNNVEFYVGESDDAESLGTASVTYTDEVNGTATLEIDTKNKQLKIGDNIITAEYGGSVNLNGSESGTITVTLEQKTVGLTWNDYKNLEYDSNPKNVTATATGIESGDGEIGVTVTGGNETNAGNHTATATELTGTYANYYKLPDNATKDYTIEPKAIMATISDIADQTYTGGAIEPQITVYDDDDTTVIPASEYTVAYSNNENAGTATVTLTDNPGGNYTVSGSTTFTIKKADSSVTTAPTKAENLVYTGEELTLLTADGIAEGGTIKYSIDGENFTYNFADIPKVKDAKDDYKVWYKVVGDANHNDTTPVCIEVKVAKKPVNTVITLTAPVKYATPETSIDTDEYTATVVWSPTLNSNGTFAINTEYTATITITPGSNYTTVGIAENGYTLDGATSVTNVADSNVITAVFPKTAGSSGGGGSLTSRYTVKFDTDGGNAITNQTVTKNSKATEPTKPTKEGYIFDGWYTDSEFTTEYDFDTKVTKNITLYAKWVIEDEVQEPSDDKKDDEQKPTTDEWKNPFTDVTKADWFFDNIRYANENSLMSGVTSTEFAPNLTLTRGMLVTILYRLAGEPAVNKSIPFADVTADSYYANAVIWAEQNGIVSGISETEFAPDENITREQIAVILYRYAKAMGYDVTVGEDTNILSYADFDEISEYAVEAMQYAVGSGLIKGKTESTLNPKDNATRAEIAAILQRFIEGNK